MKNTIISKKDLGLAIKQERIRCSMTATELAELADVSKSSLSDWESGKTQPTADALFRICDALKINPTKLIGKDKYKIPVLGTIPAGVPIEAIEDIIDYEEISAEMASSGEYFALKVKGDSMFPTIKNNDIVIIRQQPDAESGKICVVMINGYDATLKEIKKETNGIWVLPHNPNSEFKPTFYSNEEIINTPVRIIGVAVEIRRSL